MEKFVCDDRKTILIYQSADDILASDVYVVPYAFWYVVDSGPPYVTTAPLDPDAAWVRVDREPSYAK